MMEQVKITLTRSLIGYPQDQRATVKALGLGKINSTVVKNDTPTIRGETIPCTDVKVEKVEA